MTVRWEQTPHKTPRWRTTIKPEVVLVHATVSGGIEGTIAWFQNPKSKVSSDFVIGKDGEIVRMVPATHYSWHSGVCLWQGKPFRNYNAKAYGIELVNWNDGKDPYPAAQLEALAYVVHLIQTERPAVKYVRRHADVGFPVGRKSDPSGLSISQIYLSLKHHQPHLDLL